MIIAIKENDRVIVGYTNADELTKLSEEDYIHEENTPMAFTADGNFVAFSSLCSASDMLISDVIHCGIERRDSPMSIPASMAINMGLIKERRDSPNVCFFSESAIRSRGTPHM